MNKIKHFVRNFLKLRSNFMHKVVSEEMLDVLLEQITKLTKSLEVWS